MYYTSGRETSRVVSASSFALHNRRMFKLLNQPRNQTIEELAHSSVHCLGAYFAVCSLRNRCTAMKGKIGGKKTNECRVRYAILESIVK